MKILGIDYGSKRIGIAVAEQGIAFPRKILHNTDQVVFEIEEIIKKESATQIVMGDTRSFGGHQNTVSPEAERFANRLSTVTGIHVDLVWEAGSTIEAGRYATNENQHNDAASAAIILQRYIDMHMPVDSSNESV